MTAENSLAPELSSATTLLRRLRERKIGSAELLEMLLERVERLNPQLNAVVALEMERARADARAADSVSAGRRGVLHGLPITLKDTWEVAGMRSTCGLPELANHRPDRDADAVALLRAAGAIVFGKTNVPSGAADGQSYNPVFGVTNNPWDVERLPGGSSGGAGAAVAAGLTPMELGSDIAGSIRIPAHFCGVFGHKSSYGLVPMRGHIPPPPGSSAAVPLGVAGPLTRSAMDLELILDVVAAPAEPDRAAWSVSMPPSRHQRLGDFRVGVWADQETYSIDARCVAAMEGFARDLRSAGVHVESARPDIDFRASDDLFVSLLFATVSTGATEEVLAETERAAADRRQVRAVTLPASLALCAPAARSLRCPSNGNRFFVAHGGNFRTVRRAAVSGHDDSGVPARSFRHRHRTHCAIRPYVDRRWAAGPLPELHPVARRGDRREPACDGDSNGPAHQPRSSGNAGDRPLSRRSHDDQVRAARGTGTRRIRTTTRGDVAPATNGASSVSR